MFKQHWRGSSSPIPIVDKMRHAQDRTVPLLTEKAKGRQGNMTVMSNEEG